MCPVQGQWGLNFGWFWGDLKLPNAKTEIKNTENSKTHGPQAGNKRVPLHSGWLFRKQQQNAEETSSSDEDSDSEEEEGGWVKAH